MADKEPLDYETPTPRPTPSKPTWRGRAGSFCVIVTATFLVCAAAIVLFAISFHSFRKIPGYRYDKWLELAAGCTAVGFAFAFIALFFGKHQHAGWFMLLHGLSTILIPSLFVA